MDDLAKELEATSFPKILIPIANSLTDEDEADEDSSSRGDKKFKEDTIAPLKPLSALRLKVPGPAKSPKFPLGVKESVRRTPDGLGRPKFLSWASEMSMYDGCSPMSPGLPKNLPTPNSNPNLQIMYKDVYFPTNGSPGQPSLLPVATEASETTDNDVGQSPDGPNEETPEGPSVKTGRPVMCALEVIEDGFVELEAPSSPSENCSESVILTPTTLPLSSEQKIDEKLNVITTLDEKKSHGVISNSATSTDRSSPKASSQNLASNDHRSPPKSKSNKGRPKNSLRFDKPNTQSIGNSPRRRQSSSKRNNVKGQSGLSRSKVRSKKSSGTKPIRPPVFDFQNLIINYLPPDLDSARLRNLFERFGTITNCKVVLDHETGLSKGYGFVKFQTKDQAEKAIVKLNHYQIGSKTLKVSYARRTSKPRGGDSGSGKVQHTNLYIANLDKNIDSGDLQQHFSSCGYIVQCRVLKDEQGATRRIGFVRYDTHESALKAIKRYDGKKMDGTKSVIQVRFANSPRAPPNQSQSQSVIMPDEGSSSMSPPGLHAVPTPRSINGVQGAISLNGMLPNVPGQGLIEVGGHYVPISPANMQNSHEFQYTTGTVLSSHAGLQQGFRQSGLQAMTDYSPGYVASQATYAPLPQQGNSPPGVIDKQQRASNNKFGSTAITNKKSNAACYVAGIDIQTEESMLKSTFDPDGENKVKSVRIIRRRAGPYAFVNFFNSEDAAYAAETFDQTKLGSQTLTVRLKTQQ